MCGFPRPTQGSSTHTEKDRPRPPPRAGTDEKEAGSAPVPWGDSGLYPPVSPQGELHGSPGPARTSPREFPGIPRRGPGLAVPSTSCARARGSSAPLWFRPFTHGAAGRGTASPELPAGRGAQKEPLHRGGPAPGPIAQPFTSPGLHPVGAGEGGAQ